MRLIRPCTEDEFLLSFWTHQIKKGCWGKEMPLPEQRKEIIIAERWGKFPFDGSEKLEWEICEISTVEELERLCMPNSRQWLEQRKLWRGSHWLGDLAKAAREEGFFAGNKNQDTGQWKNYQCWKDAELRGRLDGHEKPTLRDEGQYTSIFDGWGRLLPYLALIYERNGGFFPFEAYRFRLLDKD